MHMLSLLIYFLDISISKLFLLSGRISFDKEKAFNDLNIRYTILKPPREDISKNAGLSSSATRSGSATKRVY